MTEEQRQATIAKLEARLEEATNPIEKKMIKSLLKIIKSNNSQED